MMLNKSAKKFTLSFQVCNCHGGAVIMNKSRHYVMNKNISLPPSANSNVTIWRQPKSDY